MSKLQQARPWAFMAGLLGLIAMSGEALAQDSQLDPRSVAYRYDGSGRLVGEIGPDPDGTGPLRFPATRTFYSPDGLVVRVETGELASWQPTNVAPASWPGFTIFQTVRHRYDTLSQQVRTEVVGSNGAVSSVTQASYDRSGRPACSATRMNPAAFAAPPANACQLGPEGSFGPDRITRNLYNVAGELIQVRKAVGTPLEIAEVTYTYTRNGRQKYVIDANGNKAELRYDGFDRLSRWVFPSKAGAASFNPSTPTAAVISAGSLNENDYELYGYDNNGNRLTHRKRDGTTISFVYDNLNRVSQKIIPSRAGLLASQVRDVFYGYDLRGLPTWTRFDSLSGAGQTVAYDGFGQVKQIVDTTAGTSRQLTYLYNADGSRTEMRYPDSQRFTYEYDLANRLVGIRHNGSTQLIRQTYDRRGPVARVDRNGVAQQRQDYAYDTIGRLSTYGITKAGYSYDVDWTFTRNPASQITREIQSNDQFTWADHYNITRTYVTNGLNQYDQVASSVGSDNFCYDMNGNLTADADEVFEYDVENRLIEKRVRTALTTCPNGTVGYSGTLKAKLEYDPLGRLFRVIDANGGVTNFLYDGEAMVAEYGANGTMLDRYVHGTNADADDPLVWYTGATVSETNRRNLYADQRGSIVYVGDRLGNKVAVNTYDAFGINGQNRVGRFGFTGQVWLEDADLYYYKSRMYSPKLGRFLQIDPIGYEDQTNLYAYVGNDPVNRLDFTGKRGDLIQLQAQLRALAAEAQLEKAVQAAKAQSRVPMPKASRAGVLALPLMTSCDSPPCHERVAVTYTKYNSETEQTYSGRTSIVVPAGTNLRAAANAAVARRDARHHMTAKGFGPAVVDKYSTNNAAVRGREQMLIDFYGGAQSAGGTSGNRINGISPYNLARPYYMMNAKAIFGSLPNNAP